MATTPTCSVLSAAAAEPIGGSAVESTAVWIVLEHRGPWAAKAVRDCDLPDAVKQRLSEWEHALPGSRVQLARRSGRCEGPLRLWLGVSDLSTPRLVEYVLPQVQALLEIDAPSVVAALRRGEPTIEGATEPRAPLVLVCTNGRRDVCCSVQGVPVARALELEPGLDVWQTTHLGGHRFAATLLQLPAGLCYGRVVPAEVPALAQSMRQGRVGPLDRLRGRTALSGAEQAAEVLWRQRSDVHEVDALTQARHESRGETVVVTLHDRAGQVHELALQHRELGVTAPPSCGKEPAPVAGWFPAG